MQGEIITIAYPVGDALEVQGCVRRDLAHSEFRIPHTAVNLVPVFRGTGDVLIHRRSPAKRICPGQWDFPAGHVTFEPAMMRADKALLAAVERAALREAREEMRVYVRGRRRPVRAGDVHRFTGLGRLVSGLDDPTSRNVEFSTGFVVFLPQTAEVVVADENDKGEVEVLVHERLSVRELVARFRLRPGEFADGAFQILSHLTKETRLASASRVARSTRLRDRTLRPRPWWARGPSPLTLVSSPGEGRCRR